MSIGCVIPRVCQRDRFLDTLSHSLSEEKVPAEHFAQGFDDAEV